MFFSMSKFRLVLCDNDGTLLNDDRELTERSREALLKLHEKGYMVGLASGRTVSDLMEMPERWNFDLKFDVLIGVNGAEFYDGITDTVHKYNYLKPEMTKRIIEAVSPFGYTMQFMRDEHYYFNKMNDFIRASMSRNATHKIRMVDDISDFWKDDIPKMLIRLPEAEMPAFEKYFEEHPIKGIIGFKTQPFVYEFMAEGTDKAVAMKKFCDLHDISLDEVISFGDTTNDNGMLKHSYGVCLLNGSDDTKAVSKQITEYDNNHDGFARYVEKYLL